MKPAHTVGVWAAGILVLALVLLGFGTFEFPTGVLPVMIFVAAAAIVAGFGLAVLLAARAGRVGAQRRQPRRASAAVFAALGIAVGLSGFVYGWWLSPLAFYPLALAAWLLRGERLQPGARPWPVALDVAEPAGPPRVVHDGSSVGVAMAVPAEHAAHGPPPPPPPRPSPRLRMAAVLLGGARALWNLIRGRRR